VELTLRKPAGIIGRAVDPDGRPLGGVYVRSYNGRRGVTRPDGTFELFGANGSVTLGGKELIEAERGITGSATNLGDIVVAPRFSVKIRAQTPDGKLVPTFDAVIRDGCYCGDYAEKVWRFTGKAGWLELDTEGPVTNVIAVSAPGFALYNEPFVLRRPLTDITVALSRGSSLSGRLLLPDGATNVTVRCEPQRDGSPWRGDSEPRWEECRSLVGADDGGLRVAHMGARSIHVAPDRWHADEPGHSSAGRWRALHPKIGDRCAPVVAAAWLGFHARRGYRSIYRQLFQPIV